MKRRPSYGDLCVFKMELAAILDFRRNDIWRHFCLWDVCFCPWTKFRVNVCNCDWAMVIKVNFQNGGRRHLGFCRKWNLTSGKVAADPYLSSHQIWWRYLERRLSYDDLCVFKMAVGRRLAFSEKWNLKVFLFPGRRFFSLSQILCKYAIVTKLWSLTWIFKMAAAAILDFGNRFLVANWWS